MPALRPRTLQLSIRAEPRFVREVRKRLEEFLKSWGVALDEIETLKLVVSEACTNAICHGSPGGIRSTVRVGWRMEGESFLVEVEDQGPGFSLGSAAPSVDELHPSGRGLFLMRQMMDQVEFDCRRSGTRVVMSRRLRTLRAPAGGEVTAARARETAGGPAGAKSPR